MSTVKLDDKEWPMRSLNKCGLLAAAVTSAIFALARPSSAGVECRGAGTWNAVFPGPPNGATTMQLAMTRSDAAWTAWVGYPNGFLGYNVYYNSDGTSLSTAPAFHASAQFSDRFVSPWPNGNAQNFAFDLAADEWDITITEDGLITIVDNTWGGTTVIAGTCAGTNGTIFGTANNIAVLVSFKAPAR